MLICVHLWLPSVLLLAGCSTSAVPQFRLNTEGREPGSISRAQGEAIAQMLDALFGTPDRPAVPEAVSLQPELLKAAAGPIGGDAEGNQWGLFRRHCAACHGISGDGAGPSAAILNPYPRDFRNGVFKYTSTAGGAKPLRDDLRRTLRQGMRGTAMPSFRKLPDCEIEALIEYVKYLSIRGQTELYLLAAVVDDDADLPLEMREAMEEGVLPAARSWEDARPLAVVPPPPRADQFFTVGGDSSRRLPENRRTIGDGSRLLQPRFQKLIGPVPPPPPIDTPERLAASVARGRELFLSDATQCVRCHGRLGDGNGEQSELYDDWNKRKKGATADETRQLAQAFSAADPGVASAKLHPGNIPRRRSADRSVLAHLRGHQGDADAAGRRRPRQSGRAIARGYLARGQLRAIAGREEVALAHQLDFVSDYF